MDKKKKGLLYYLTNIQETKRKIEYLTEWRKEVLDTRISIKGIDYSKEKVSINGTSDLSNSIIKLEKIEEDLTKAINGYCFNLLKALSITQRIKDTKTRLYITKKFIAKRSYRSIAAEEQESPSKIFKKVNKVLSIGK